MRPKNPERLLEIQIIEILAYRGVRLRKNLVEPARGKASATGLGKGSADLVGIDRKQGGRAVYVECKSKDGRLSKEQEAFRDEVIADGAVYVLARSVHEAIAGVEMARRGRAA